ncbi:MAG: PilN domain-containing protein [Gammaproteobacteria bacterium]|nr:PilN domain-containing protein [Gammaproteobacteria bacterium]MDH5512587.1 PilN domain-containing protein [Gammaproteobacteria bacterium]
MTTRVNLLPWREMRRKEQDRQLLTIAVGAWILMGVIIFYAHVHVSALIENQERRNEFLNQEIAKVEKEIKEIAELKKKRADLIARMNVIYQLQGDRTQVVHLFDELARKLPEGIYLASMNHKGSSIAIKGVAQSNARVSALMRNLAASDWFAEPELEVITVKAKGNDRISEFSLKVKQFAKQQKKLVDTDS